MPRWASVVADPPGSGVGAGRAQETPKALEALQWMHDEAESGAYSVIMDFRPGDMQFINNYHVLHGRTPYEDDRAAGKVRHLKRLWLETEVLTNAEKPERFRLGRTDSFWSSKGRTKSELDI